jgi:cardiolipin synthase
LVALILMMLVAFDRLRMPSLLPALVILAREILVSGLREFLADIRVSVPVSRLAKWKTGIQMVAIGVLLMVADGPEAHLVLCLGEVLLWVAALLTLVTGYDYLRAGLKHMIVAEEKPAERVAAVDAGPTSARERRAAGQAG